MLSPINTGGFDVNVMPTYTAPNPQLLAKYNPQPIISGIQGAANIGKAIQELQVQPSETANIIAGQQLETGQKQYLSGLNPAASIAIGQGEKPITTQEENSFDPETGQVKKTTRTFASGSDTSDPTNAISTSTAVDQQPKIFQTGSLNVTPEGTGVTTNFFMPKDPSKQAFTLDPQTGLYKPNDNAIPMKSDYVFQKNLMGRGAQANAAQSAIFMDLMQKATDPEVKAYYAKAIDDLQNGNEADADKNAALAQKYKTDHQNSQELQDKKDKTAEDIATGKDQTAEDIAKGKNATTIQSQWIKQYGAENAAKIKNWSDEAKAYETLAQKATDADEKQQAMFQAMKRRAMIGKMVEDGTLNAGNMASGEGGSSVTPGGNAGPGPTPEQVQELVQNPQFASSFIKKFGQAEYDKAMQGSQRPQSVFSQIGNEAGPLAPPPLNQ